MATSPRLISLNFGSQTVGLAEFRVQAHGGLVLLDYRLREAPLDPATGQRREAHTALHETAVALREMMSELHIKHGAVNCALPAQSVFARFVKLPSLEHEKLEKVIAFEAQQNVPFPIDDVVWDYQVVGGGLDEQIQVILVAIKHDLLDGVNGAVEETGLLTSTIDVAPMALYNAFRYSYPNVNDCALLVDIGARTTNVLFIEPRRIFSRSLPIGGSSITGAIAKEFGESFEAAETRKKRDGFVGLGGAYAEPSDHDTARVSKLARSTMTRLHAELMQANGGLNGTTFSNVSITSPPGINPQVTYDTNHVYLVIEPGGTPTPTPTTTPTATPTPTSTPRATPRPRPTPHQRPTPR